MERATHRPFDRIVAVACVGVLAVLLFGLVSSSHVEPDHAKAAGDLLTLMRSGEHTIYMGEYAFVRTRADGSRLPATLYEGHGPRGSLSRSGNALTIDLSDATYECSLLDDKPGCFKKPAAESLPQSEVVRVLVDHGDYEVSPLPAAKIAGEHARCFAVSARVETRQLPDLGPRAEMCFAADGVPLKTTTSHTGARDERTATRISRTWDDASLAPALAGFEKASPQVGG